MKNSAEIFLRWGGSDSIYRYDLHDDFHGDHRFLISPYHGKTENWSIQSKELVSDDYFNHSEINFKKPLEEPDAATHKNHAEYLGLVHQMVEAMNTSSLNKVVTARSEFVSCQVNPFVGFQQLCTAYPQAHIYLLNHPDWGCWMGATPELLLKTEEDSLYTMSLAGTRSAGIKGDWGAKERLEQAYVTDFLKEKLQEHKVSKLSFSPLRTKSAGPIEHLCTDIEGDSSMVKDLVSLIDDLHPTPAVCGIPRDLAQDHLLKKEDLDRKLYSGFLGEWSHDLSNIAVNLRCLNFVSGGVTLWAGGGLTAESDAQAEWEETEKKMSTLRRVLSI